MTLPSSVFVMAMLLMAAHLHLYEAKYWFKVTTKCPELEICHCWIVKRGANILCADIDSGDELARELPRLSNTTIFQLTVKHSNLTVIPSFYLANLDILMFSLVDTPVKIIEENAFANVTKLRSLRLESNRLKTIPAAFSTLSELTILHLSSNLIDAVNEELVVLRNLKELDLSRNRIKYLNPLALKNLNNLRILRLGNNDIEYLPSLFFKRAKHLVLIDLHNNRIKTIYEAFQGLVQLQTLLLFNNDIINMDRLSNGNVPKLRILRAANNSITDIRKNLRNLQVVLLQRNRLQAVHRQSFPPSLDKLRTLVIEANPIVCDCQLSWLMTDAVHVSERGEPICEGPSWLKGNHFYNLTLESLTTWKEGCDQKCTCECQDGGAFGRDVFVNCSDRGLTKLPVTLPIDTRALDLSGNKLESLDAVPSETAGLAKNAPFLSFLNLSNNLLSSIGPSTIPLGTKELSLRGNKLTRFPIALVSNITLSNLELAGNPWSCGCEDYAFRQWAEAYAEIVDDAAEITCAKGPNHLISLKRFMDLGQKDLCPSMMSEILFYGLPILVLLIISLAASTAYLRHKREIKVWLYARGVCSSLQCIKEDDLDEDKIFDVFLSFSSKDSTWAYEQLIPGIEVHDFSVCTYDRNFKGGFLLQDIIQEAVSCSRRTLLLLTNNFVESEWCRWEFRVAHHQALEDKINRLIVVLVDEVAPDLVDEELQLYMKTTNYLRWGEPHFWDKLIYSLPKKDSRRKLILNSQEYPMTVKFENTEP